jgi:carboxymethylenebutenolidase
MMGEWIKLTASDDFVLDAYVARPEGAPKASVVVLQEIFGVNSHIRSVADLYAKHGYLAVAPALFDRKIKNFEVGYGADDVKAGREIAFALDRETTLRDIEAAITFARQSGKTGLVGYCWGGTMAYASACSLSGLSAVSAYYGGGVTAMKDHAPKVPTILHFGERDAHIPMEGVNDFKAARPDTTIYVYAADHGFNCDQRGSFDESSAALARSRTLDHFAKHLS